MRGIVREGMQAGALGLSVSKNRGHYDPQGVHIPAFWAEEAEIFALADVLSELGVGTIQSGGGRDAELDNRLMTRLAEACGRQVVYNNLGQSVRQPEAWKQHMALIDETAKAGIRANPLCTPNSNMTRFTMRNTQAFRGIPTWHPILLASDEEKLRAYSDPAVRQKLHQEVVEWVGRPARRESRPAVVRLYLGGRDGVAQESDSGRANRSGKWPRRRARGSSTASWIWRSRRTWRPCSWKAPRMSIRRPWPRSSPTPTPISASPTAAPTCSSMAAMATARGLLGYWVRQEGIMSLEQAVRRLTFESASTFGIYDRGCSVRAGGGHHDL